MPSRNTTRFDSPDSYYHVYARGASKGNIFLESADKDYFLYLFSRYLSHKQVTSKSGVAYPHHRDHVELLAYCLMDNHFHLLIFQHEIGALSAFMKSIMTSYSAYFNRKYKRSGHLFENRYKSSRITSDAYLLHISRYIYLNPRSWKYYPYSSLIHIRRASEPEWLQNERVLAQHATRQAYLEFVADYEENLNMLAEIKHELANL
ncbi:MAG: transposase [Candidatus Saccharimonadales bacterium]